MLGVHELTSAKPPGTAYWTLKARTSQTAISRHAHTIYIYIYSMLLHPAPCQSKDGGPDRSCTFWIDHGCIRGQFRCEKRPLCVCVFGWAVSLHICFHKGIPKKHFLACWFSLFGIIYACKHSNSCTGRRRAGKGPRKLQTHPPKSQNTT